ncbi:hypothetical protein I4U23_005660 [Adineta vaga]|nr:hypothetical protein I4U23_005660 [Adineta vaga]
MNTNKSGAISIGSNRERELDIYIEYCKAFPINCNNTLLGKYYHDHLLRFDNLHFAVINATEKGVDKNNNQLKEQENELEIRIQTDYYPYIEFILQLTHFMYTLFLYCALILCQYDPYVDKDTPFFSLMNRTTSSC